MLKKAQLLKHLESNFQFCKEFIISFAGYDTDCLDVIEAKPASLPLLVGRKLSEKARSLLELRLKGKDVHWPREVLYELYNKDFEPEDYRHIGNNDGTLYALADIYKLLGLHDKAREVCTWIYDPEN